MSTIQEPIATDRPDVPIAEPTETLYEIVAARRLGYDSMMWQTPVLSLTAQAFLLTIALGEGGKWARCMSGFLALLAALSSLQLMVKHRAYEEADSRWLKAYEDRWFNCKPVHGSGRAFFQPNWVARLSSYRVWRWTLAVFGLAGFLTALNAALGWGWFETANQ